MADKYQHEIKRSLKEIGITVRFDQTSRFATSDQPGRADGVVTYEGRSAFVECKTGDTAWHTRFADPSKGGWTQQQREFAAQAEAQGTPYFIALTIGTGAPNATREGVLPRCAYLIPYTVAIPVVTWGERHGFHSIPYKAFRNTHALVKQFNMAIDTQFAPYALQWAGKGRWVIPQRNPLLVHLMGRGA